jgi:hypothetical protein
MKTSLGEDLLGDLSENIDGSVTIKKPCLVVIGGTEQGGFSIRLFPYLPFAEQKEFTFRKEQVFFQYEAALDLKNEYIRLNSGIVTPTAEDKARIQLLQ